MLDTSTCASCVVMHGTFHTLDETLDDHYNGRCAMLPVVKGFPRVLEEGAGEAWFREQPEATQRGILGPGRLDAWNNELFEFSRLSNQVNDDVYGTMRVEAALRDLIGGE